MDIWEANSAATAFTPHPCNVTGLYKCTGALCGSTADRYSSVCDMDGCDYNAYRLGQVAFYQPNNNATAGVDTDRPFTVVTQFLTTTTGDATGGSLREIRRLYVQDDRVVENAIVQVPGIDKGNSITDEFCAQEKEAFGGAVNAFRAQGGLRGMGEALGRGMVLVMSVWDDSGSAMKWLDATFPDNSDPAKDPGTARGPCKPDEGKAEDLLKTAPWARVKFSNVKSGEIGSTYKGKNKGLVGGLR
jgi:cellulose 1,4-beta-cellobiosidase